MKKIILALCVLVVAGLFIACDGTVNASFFEKPLQTIKSLKIRETNVKDFKADKSAPTLVSSNWSELGLTSPLVEYLKSDMTTTTTNISEAAAVRITAEGQTAVVNLGE